MGIYYLNAVMRGLQDDLEGPVGKKKVKKIISLKSSQFAVLAAVAYQQFDPTKKEPKTYFRASHAQLAATVHMSVRSLHDQIDFLMLEPALIEYIEKNKLPYYDSHGTKQIWIGPTYRINLKTIRKFQESRDPQYTDTQWCKLLGIQMEYLKGFTPAMCDELQIKGDGTVAPFVGKGVNILADKAEFSNPARKNTSAAEQDFPSSEQDFPSFKKDFPSSAQDLPTQSKDDICLKSCSNTSNGLKDILELSKRRAEKAEDGVDPWFGITVAAADEILNQSLKERKERWNRFVRRFCDIIALRVYENLVECKIVEDKAAQKQGYLDRIMKAMNAQIVERYSAWMFYSELLRTVQFDLTQNRFSIKSETPLDDAIASLIRLSIDRIKTTVPLLSVQNPGCPHTVKPPKH